MDIPYLDQETLDQSLHYDRLIDELDKGFASQKIITPSRHHHNFQNPHYDNECTLLLMPSWEEGDSVGVKLVAISPGNEKFNLPSIQGVYVLFDKHGTPIAILDAKTLTVKRTAATSALASKYLSRKDSNTLLIIGTGAMVPELVKAHISVRPIENVLVWGRNQNKAREVADSLKNLNVSIVQTVEEGMANADIISTATMSFEPLVLGSHLKEGQHLDLVGSYQPTMREADDDVIERSQIYIDTEMAMKESGDLSIPLGNGLINGGDIQGTLFSLCDGSAVGRKDKNEITLFKSVGHALEDLVGAKMAFKSHQLQHMS